MKHMGLRFCDHFVHIKPGIIKELTVERKDLGFMFFHVFTIFFKCSILKVIGALDDIQLML